MSSPHTSSKLYVTLSVHVAPAPTTQNTHAYMRPHSFYKLRIVCACDFTEEEMHASHLARAHDPMAIL